MPLQLSCYVSKHSVDLTFVVVRGERPGAARRGHQTVGSNPLGELDLPFLGGLRQTELIARRDAQQVLS